MYTQAEYSGSNTITKNIVVNGRTYNQGVTVNSNLDLKMLDAEYQYDIIKIDNILAGLSVGVLGEIKYIDSESRLNSPGLEKQQ